ncbi:MAG: 3-deoxy-manno-octulosonate cytidylyltransferase [Bacteroidota bacterium]
MKILGVIPARYASTRFPGKPLVLIKGKTMIQRVYEQAMKAKSLDEVTVATDDQRIYDHVRSFGGTVMMTSSRHPCGTDRCAEAARKIKTIKPAVVINIQGDEPFIDPRQIDKVAECFSDKKVQIATLAKKLDDVQELHSPNTIKVIFDKNRKAIYFSRLPIPFNRTASRVTYHKHIGIYAYRADVLQRLTRLKPTPLELAESLEQLRWLENGYSIRINLTSLETFSIDSPEDLKKVK